MAVNVPLTALLCLSGALLTAGAPVGNGQGCPEGWTPFGTRCFKFFDIPLTWAKAEKSCQSHGANLASIHSAEENALVADLTQRANGETRLSWIGGHDAFQENLWMWSDGSHWDFSNWHPGQPDHWEGNEDFLMFNWPDKSALLWNDGPGSVPLVFICAKDSQMC